MRPLLAVLVVAGCAKPTLEEECQKQMQVTCRKLFECDRPAAELLYTNQDMCRASLGTLCDNYKAWTCDDRTLTQYDQCINDNASRQCSSGTPASCDTADLGTTCRPSPSGGRTTCSASTMSSDATTCSVTISTCSNGLTYRLTCSDSSCTCFDGYVTRMFTGTCGDSSQAIASCKWNIG